MAERKFRIRYADVASTLALVLAMSGTAYAATALPRNSVGTPQLKAEAVTAAKLRPGAVTAPKMGTGAVSNPNLASNAVSSAKVLNGGIGRADLAEGSVGTTQLADGGITTVKIGAGQITEGHIFPGAIGTGQVGDHSLRLVDVTAAERIIETNNYFLPAGGCPMVGFGAVTGAQTGQIALAAWQTEVPREIVPMPAAVEDGFVYVRLCNFGATNYTTPAGTLLKVVTIG